MKIKQKYTIFILEQHPAAPICPQDGKMLMHVLNHSGENLYTRSGLFFFLTYIFLFGKPGFQNTSNKYIDQSLTMIGSFPCKNLYQLE